MVRVPRLGMIETLANTISSAHTSMLATLAGLSSDHELANPRTAPITTAITMSQTNSALWDWSVLMRTIRQTTPRPTSPTAATRLISW